MKTDSAFAQLFSGNPAWLKELTGLDLPEFKGAGLMKFKGVEREADLVLQPQDPASPHYVVEFQMQLDNRIYSRTSV